MANEFVNNGSSGSKNNAALSNSVRKSQVDKVPIAEHPAAAEQDALVNTEPAAETTMNKGQGVTSEVTFFYIDGMGRGDPLR